MKLPTLALPSQAMPWGRAIQDAALSGAQGLRAIQGDSLNAGRQFASNADALSSQIKHVRNTATIARVPVMPFTASLPSDPGPQTAASAPYFASPPVQGATECRVIANFEAEKIGGSGAASMAIAVPVMRVNNKVVGALMQVNRQAPNVFTSMMGSLSTVVPLVPGEAVSVEIGVRFGFTPGIDISVYNASIWFAFYGSVQ